MKDGKFQYIDISELRLGLYIELELGWMAHPFPTGSFKITSQKQIAVIAGLGLTRVAYIPEKSDPDPSVVATMPPEALGAGQDPALMQSSQATQYEENLRRQQAQELRQQELGLMECERRFGEAQRQYSRTVQKAQAHPKDAAELSRMMVSGLVGEMCEGQCAIRLLTQSYGEKSSMHPVNVTVLCLLLGKAIGLASTELLDLGMAAFLHDIGKAKLPERVRWFEPIFTSAEAKAYQEHVWYSVQTARAMELSEATLSAISQHHELVDGTGFPLRLQGAQLSRMGMVLALINRYDNLCNPARASSAVTPHEALALIFSQFKSGFDSATLDSFIRMMGVYPPGSVVQLTDERYAIVVSVNAGLPQKPGIIVYDLGVPRHAAPILEMEHAPNISIRRSLKPASLPAAALEYLAPRQRVAYFFERLVDSTLPREAQ